MATKILKDTFKFISTNFSHWKITTLKGHISQNLLYAYSVVPNKRRDGIIVDSGKFSKF